MKRLIVAPIVMLMLLGTTALADDPAPVDAGIVDAGAQPVDPVVEAEKVIDEAIKEIDEDPGAATGVLVELAKSGRWGPFAGLLILFIIWGLRKFIWKLIPKNVLPWLTLGLAMVASIAVGLLFGNVWWEVLIDGLITGGSAGLLWSALFKHFMKPKEA